MHSWADDPDKDAAPPPPYRPSVVGTLRKSAADAWLHLAASVSASVMWVTLLVLPFSILGKHGLRPGVGAWGVVATLLTAAAGNAILFRLTNRMAHDEVALADLRAAITDNFVPSLALLAILAAVLTLGGFNVYFYLKVVSAPAWHIIGILWGYVMLLFGIAMLYSYPLLIEQRCGALTAVGRSALLFLDNPGYTLGIAGALMLWTLVVVFPLFTPVNLLKGITALAFFFLQAGVVALTANNALLALLRKYAKQERSEDGGGGVPGDPGS
jgi:hypothetical protein